MSFSTKRNENNVPFLTRWKHLDRQDYLYFDSFTPMSIIIGGLEKEINIKYSERQIVNLKQYYHKGEGTTKTICQGWIVEYFVNESYTRTVNLNENGKEFNKNQVLTHELYPLVRKVDIAQKDSLNIKDLGNELNENMKTPDRESFQKQMLADFEKLTKISDSITYLKGLGDVHQDYVKRISKFVSITKIELKSEELKSLLWEKREKVKGWFIELNEE